MIKKRTVLCVAIVCVISIGLLSGCANAASTEQNTTENTTESTTDTLTENAVEAEESATEESASEESITEEATFGLQDYEGLYCETGTEQIEDYEITYTYGYQFNGDGTGVCYAQDNVDFTWNETEIHFADRTIPFTMEPGKLTVEDIVYNKIEGRLITPNPYYVDTNNIEDGIYYAFIDKSGINEANDGLTIKAEIYTMDTYDIVDISQMAKGDVIYINGQLFPIDTIEKNDLGLININGGLENGGTALIAEDESNCFVFAGMDAQRSFSRQGIADFAVSENVKLFDYYDDPNEGKEYTGGDVVSALKEMTEEYPLTCYNCSIMVEGNQIIEIKRLFVP